jgi:hypothetical protein
MLPALAGFPADAGIANPLWRLPLLSPMLGRSPTADAKGSTAEAVAAPIV